jgi:flagellar hook protein FlgE
MSFQTGLSGLNVASQTLDVIGNNIANANTVGMKESRAEFADLIASAIGAGGASTSAGIGVSTAAVSQQFTQGTISITGNNLDLAINGGGFFQVTRTDGTVAYTRDGQFKLDKDGNIVTNTGANVMGFPTDVNGVPTGTTPQKLSIPTGAPIAAKATTSITASFNLDSRVAIAATATPPTPRSTYGTSVTTYDSQGNAIPESLYFTKIDPTTSPVTTGPTPPATATDQWAVYDTLSTTDASGNTINPIGYMAFNSAGGLQGAYDANGTLQGTYNGTTTGLTGKLPLTITNPNTTAGNITPTVDLSAVTEYGTSFAVSNLAQDGYTAGNFTSLNIDSTGVITTNYSNGQTLKTGGMVALGSFRNDQGLQPTGAGEYLETFKSGSVVLGDPSVGQFGALQSGAVEESNVDLTSELVNMMTAQRNYQANAQTIKTEDQIMSTLVNLR